MTTTTQTNKPSAASSSIDSPSLDSSVAPAILRRIFTVDRAFAAVSAVGLIVGGVLIADVLDWPTWVVIAIGVGLAPYALLLHTVCRSGAYRSTTARLTAVGDAAWVVASVALLVGWPDATSTIGTWIIAAIAVVVADIGLVKVYGCTRNR